MKVLFDAFPVLLFFLVYWLADIYYATAVMVIAAVVQLMIGHWGRQKIQPMQSMALVLLILFGGLTLILHDDRFIMWKPTVVNWLFAAGFLIASVVDRKPLIQRMLGGQIVLPQKTWAVLNWSWILFFFLVGVINWYVAFGHQLQVEDLDGEQRTVLQKIQADSHLYATTVLRTDYADLGPDERQSVAALNPAEIQHNYLRKLHMDYWVSFKLFGLTGLSVAFMLLQFAYLWTQRIEPVSPGSQPG